MYLLVDYDNVDELQRIRGVTHTIEHTLGRIPTRYLSDVSRIEVRLYGGWFRRRELSIKAQQLAREIDEQFPKPLRILRDGVESTYRVQVALARSLLVDPTCDLFYTFRERGYPSGIQCYSAPFEGCVNPTQCSLEAIAAFVDTRQCAAAGCTVNGKKVLFRTEQKLVDTMLTADLIDVSKNGEPVVCVVSNDDDIWPGIRVAFEYGTTILHVHPRKDRRTPDMYADPLRSAYFQFSY